MRLEEQLKLAICIPTHHGRVRHLQTLIESILANGSISATLADLQICVSDNASSDGTEELIRRYSASYGPLFKYHRNATNTGILNFFTAVDMADTEYCWLMGSDDALVPNAIETVRAHLAKHTGISALTINKINFNRDLTRLIGPDNAQVLPSNPNVTRILHGPSDILTNLFMPFAFISAHVFRKSAWTGIVQAFGLPHILTFPNFPHVLVYSQMALKTGEWLWVADYCVIQRLENFSFVEQVSDKPIVYATELTEELRRLARTLFPDEGEYRSAVKRLCVVYWNPWFALKYRAVTSKSDWRALRVVARCKRWFKHNTLFWLTTYPVLIMPAAAGRMALKLVSSMYRALTTKPFLAAVRVAGRVCFQAVLRWAGVDTEWGSPTAEAAAESYLATAKGLRSERAEVAGDSERGCSGRVK